MKRFDNIWPVRKYFLFPSLLLSLTACTGLVGYSVSPEQFASAFDFEYSHFHVYGTTEFTVEMSINGKISTSETKQTVIGNHTPEGSDATLSKTVDGKLTTSRQSTRNNGDRFDLYQYKDGEFFGSYKVSSDLALAASLVYISNLDSLDYEYQLGSYITHTEVYPYLAASMALAGQEVDDDGPFRIEIKFDSKGRLGSIEAKAEDAPLLSAAGDSSGLESTIKRYVLRYDFSYSGVSLLSI